MLFPSGVKGNPFTDSEILQIAKITLKNGIPYKVTAGYSAYGQFICIRVRGLTSKYLLQFYHTEQTKPFGIEYNKRALTS